MRTHTRIIAAHHLIFSSYGFWLANDPRGSGSESIRQDKFEDLGPIHHGRKKLQPTRAELRTFYEEATPRLEFAPIWFDAKARDMIADTFARVIAKENYTVWSCAILRNHAHLCVRRHRDDYQTIWEKLTTATRDEASRLKIIPEGHPLGAQRPYSVFLYDSDDIMRVIEYIKANPEKEGLPPQSFPFVKDYRPS